MQPKWQALPQIYWAGDTLYNRYVPQPDGSYTRNRMQDASKRAVHKMPSPEPEHTPPPPISHPRPNPPAGNFLKRLLPRDFDTGDLIVILLLLLMAGDSQEDRNNAILTIALYLLMYSLFLSERPYCDKLSFIGLMPDNR